jgi:CBS domain-containing protein
VERALTESTPVTLGQRNAGGRDHGAQGGVCVNPSQTVEECTALMNAKRVRHLPDDGTLLGIVSIGDLVKSIISDREFVVEQLEHYIHG